MDISAPLLRLAEQFRVIAAEELLPRHGKLRDDQVKAHSDGSLYTEADLAAERRLTESARAIYPDAIPTGEEEISEDPAEFFSMARGLTVVIFDPIDGTGAFKRGEDTYGMMGALIRNGETEGGIIYTPGHAVRDNNGILYPEQDITIIAEKNKGCWIYQGNNIDRAQRIDLSGRALKLKDHARIAFACRNQDKPFEAVLAEGVPGYVTRNNSSHDYTRLLTGKTDATFYSEGFMPDGSGKCPPWDHAAGVLAVQEAGGYAALPYAGSGGEPYTPLHCHDRLLVAASRDLFDDVMLHVSSRTPHFIKPRI